MPLFQIQDHDRPMFVVAVNYHHAVQAWLNVVAIENEMDIKEVEPPIGVNYLCPDNELILLGFKQVA